MIIHATPLATRFTLSVLLSRPYSRRTGSSVKHPESRLTFFSYAAQHVRHVSGSSPVNSFNLKRD